MPKCFDVWTVEREIRPPRREAGRSYHADVICEVSPTEARYGDPARTAEENARRIADALNDAEGWYGPATEAAADTPGEDCQVCGKPGGADCGHHRGDSPAANVEIVDLSLANEGPFQLRVNGYGCAAFTTRGYADEVARCLRIALTTPIRVDGPGTSKATATDRARAFIRAIDAGDIAHDDRVTALVDLLGGETSPVDDHTIDGKPVPRDVAIFGTSVASPSSGYADEVDNAMCGRGHDLHCPRCWADDEDAEKGGDGR